MLLVLLLALLLLLSVGNVDAVHSVKKQDKLNAAIGEAIAQNSYLFSTFATSQANEGSWTRSLCSHLQPDDPDRNRVGCCQPTKMKVLYNVKLHNKQFEMIDYKKNVSGGMYLPILYALR